MKIILNGIVFMVLSLLFIPIVNAKEIYYSNQYNVNFTKEEYDFIDNYFYKGYQETLTPYEYNVIFSYDVLNGRVNSKEYFEYENLVQPFGTSHSSPSKKITISTICTSNCLVILDVEWIKSPNVRSYDVIGAYLDGVHLETIPVTKVLNSTGINISNEIVYDFQGFGVSIELLKNGGDMKINQTFRVSGEGLVYGSYQHATQSISLANSKKYKISHQGYGNVFLFDSKVKDYYDAMSGVNILI